jgi:segregation and condensation protein B
VTTREVRLSQAALEVLAVVAYRQPVAKTDIEFVRGCDCDGVLRTLLARRLVAIKGRSEAPGRPLLYVTTDRFLEYFGLAQLVDLPDWSEITALVGEGSPQGRLTLVRGAETVASTPDSEPASPATSLKEQEAGAMRSLPPPEADLVEVSATVELAAATPREDAS